MRRRSVLLTLLILTGFVAVPVFLTWRQVRHEQLNHALIAAVTRDDVAEVRALLHQGADANTRVPWPEISFIVTQSLPPDASVSPAPSFWTRWLTKLFPTPPKNFRSVLSYACWQDAPASVLRALLDAGADANATDSEGQTVLMGAVFVGKTANVRLMLKAGARVDTVDSRQQTALMWAGTNSQTDDLSIIRLLLSHHANVHLRDADGDTALAVAASDGKFRKMEALLAGGADVNVANNDGETPLQHAACSLEPTAVQLLLTHRADANHRDRGGNSPMHMARISTMDGKPSQTLRKAVLRLLRQAGAKD